MAELSGEEREAFLSGLSLDELVLLEFDWRFWGRGEQQIPGGDWDFWLIMAGRGWGKTRTGAEAVKSWEERGVPRFHLVGATAADVRDVMIEGESGLLSVYPPRDRPLYEPTKTRLTWPRRSASGAGRLTLGESAVAQVYSAEQPDRLRGPQCHKAWCDEPAAWRYQQETWDNFVLGLRLGDSPQAVLTTTPRPTPLMRALVSDKRTVVTRGSTYDNVDNLAPLFAQEIIQRYEGTRLGRQELYAELLDDLEGALWNRVMLEENRWAREHGHRFHRTVVSIDPAVTANPNSDETGIIGCGETEIEGTPHYGVLIDYSGRYTPDTWGAIAVNLYYELDADCIVAENNQGGDLVEANIKRIDPNVPVKMVRAKDAKLVRATPVVSLYEQKRVHHVGMFAKLEDQQCSWTGEKDWKGPSPDRVDALVWGITYLSDRRKRKWRLL